MKLTTLIPLFLILLSLVPDTASGEEKRPNIIFILADDLGYGDIKAFGGALTNIDTPHFDSLCEKGMKFTDAHVTNSMCVPSRTSIMTGRYAFRFGAAEEGGPWGFSGLRFPPTQHTLGSMMRQAGYATGYVGKWHLGTRMTTRDGGVQNSENTDFTKPIQIGVPQYGFDESFILPGSLDMFPYVFAKNNEWLGPVTEQKGWSAFNRVGPASKDFVDHEVLGRFSEEAESYISKQAKTAEPFFLFLALTAPHTPTSPAPEFEGKSRIGLYGDFVMNTDACIGRVIAALDEAGITDDTMVIASSDHGPGHYSGKLREATANQMKEMEKDGHHPTGPWRGYKFSALEGGSRIPFAVKWPGVVAEGSVSDALVGMNDLMATFADISGAALAKKHAPDSISFLPLLKDADTAAPRTSMVIQGSAGNAYREGPWKLLLCPGSGSSGRFATTPETKTAWREALETYGKSPASPAELEQAPFLQLFHLDNDPRETTNLAAEHPERIAEMISSLRSIIASGRSTPGPALPVNRELDLFHPVPDFVWAVRE